MSEEAYFLRNQAPDDQPPAPKRREQGDTKTPDGPPFWFCEACGKEMEGTWSGQKTYPKCPEHPNGGCYVAQAIKWAPKGIIVLLGESQPFREKKFVCSQECRKKLDPDAKLQVF